MRLVRDHEDQNARTDDEARLWISGTGKMFDSPVPPIPTEFKATRLGDIGTRTVEIERLTLIGQGIFGEGRPCSWSDKTKWTGDAYTYGVYTYVQPGDKRPSSALIIENNGSGSHFWIVEGSEMIFFLDMVTTLPKEKTWDLCHLLIRTSTTAAQRERRYIFQVVAEKRLKVSRRRRGVVSFDILPAKGTTEATIDA